MTPQPAIRRILYLQNPATLRLHHEPVRRHLETAIPGVELTLASSAAEVPEGGCVDAVITPTLAWLPEALARLADYRWIHFLSAGVDRIWAMDFDKQAPLMSKSSGVNADAMAEYVLGAMLYFSKRFGRFQAQSVRACWERVWLTELSGTSVAILGLGQVGQAVAVRAKAFGMRVLGSRRRPEPVAGVDAMVALSDVHRHLESVNFLVVCLPLTSATAGFVDATLLARLKPGAVLIDISRGGIVDARALLDALDSRHLQGAALDVFETEPLPEDSPLWGREDLLLTPHVAGTTQNYLERALHIFLDNLSSLQHHGRLATPVDLALGY